MSSIVARSSRLAVVARTPTRTIARTRPLTTTTTTTTTSTSSSSAASQPRRRPLAATATTPSSRRYSAAATAAAAKQHDTAMARGSTTPAIRLSNATLARLGEAPATEDQPRVRVPTYERATQKQGIVHIGVGGFHRAHLAVYVDALLATGLRDWAICGVGLQPFDAAMRDALVPQDGLYTVLERAASGSSARVVGSITGFLFAPDSPEAVVAKMAHADTHIVSMTITESGYYYNENTHQLEADHPDIVADLQSSDLSAPRTTFGYLFAALQRRQRAGLKPFTVLSCDNMQKNGTITKNMLLAFARRRDAGVAAWIEAHGAFPNSMVDRITPRTADADKAGLAATYGVADAWPVVTEPFMQWVVEDVFADGRPPFEATGVQVVRDVAAVEAFECHKLRLLNAGHTAMAYLAFLGGFAYVHEVMAHPLFRRYLGNMMRGEVKPLLPAIAGVDIDAYCDQLMERFANPTIMDQITRLTLNGSGKLPQFIMPSVAEHIMAGTRDFRRLVLCVASWFRFLHGVDEHGKPYAIDDPMAADLHARAKAGGTAVYPLLDVKSLFGDDLRDDKVFVDELSRALEALHRDGAMATLEKYA